MKGFDTRIVEYEYIHSIKPVQLLRLNQATHPKQGEVILDAEAGYGAVSKSLYEYCLKKNICVQQYLLEESAPQIKRARKNLPWMRRGHFLLSSMLQTGFKDNFFDTVIIKMGLHELPRNKQSLLFKEVQRILKPKGKLIIWDLALTSENQSIFQDIIRKKDRLAGFKLLAKNRYFCQAKEIITGYQKSGFCDAKAFYQFTYRFSSKKRLEQELGGSEKKLHQLNSYIQQRIPDSQKKEFQYQSLADDVQFNVIKAIFTGKKI